MTEGQEWGVWKWLTEKRRVREAADRATEALREAREKAGGRRTAADAEAQKATDDAEVMFAEAERKMSASLAREAAKKALESYDLREKAIRKAEARK
jgi:hypothetical protein